MLNIYLLRHGETAWNADGNRYCGRTDLPLTDNGVMQAENIAQAFKSITFDAIYASPLQRALQTAQIVSGHKEIIIDDRLIEVDFGNWEGKTKEEFIVENKTLWENWTMNPEKMRAGGIGETAVEVVNRVDDFYRFLLEEYPQGNILIVGHNGINRFYLSFKLGMPLKNYRKFFLDNAAVTMFSLDGAGNMLLQRLNSKV